MKALDLSTLVVVDTETTGENPFVHEILSAAFVPVEQPAQLEVHVKVRDNASWSKYGQSLFEKIEGEWQQRAVLASEAVQKIEEFLDSHYQGREVNLVGHNVAFDRFFLARLASRAGVKSIRGISHRTVDTHSLLTVLHILGKIPSEATSSSGAFEYFNIKVPKARRHTALGDAVATRELFLRLIDELR